MGFGDLIKFKHHNILCILYSKCYNGITQYLSLAEGLVKLIRFTRPSPTMQTLG